MSEKLRTVRLYGPLGVKFGREHKFVVASPAEAIQALTLQLKGFEEHLRDEGYGYAILVGKRHLNLTTKLDELHEPPGDGDIRIVPVPAGAKRGGLFQVIIGVVLIVASWYAGGAMGWGYLGASGYAGATMAFTAGVSLALGGVAQMLSPQPKLNLGESAENRASAYFNGPAQTAPQGNPVPIFYGEGIVGSVPISAGIYAENSH